MAKILKIGYNPTEYAKVMLIPPITLMLQLIETSMTTINNVITTLNGLQIKIDPILLLEQYVPYVNWKKLLEKSDKSNLQNSISNELTSVIGSEANSNMGM
jgi:hypothetical protein